MQKIDEGFAHLYLWVGAALTPSVLPIILSSIASLLVIVKTITTWRDVKNGK
jgi:hypothetical protein